jgi:7,8-dihydropterin-6-yl-methyl-4-(beta-D-ribofuranosyl)aminobenzene 5'-phosphate synthase
MSSKQKTLVLAALLLMALGPGGAAVASAGAPAGPTFKFTVLYDNYVFRDGTKADWGFSCLIEGAEKTILFDTGTKPEILIHNVDALGIDLAKIDLIVLSHAHADHTGGLSAVLARNARVEVLFPASFGAGFAAMITKAGAAPRAVDKPVEICRNVFLTGELGGPIKEMALVLDTSRGLVVLTGCSHPGIVDILKRVKEIRNSPIHLVFGGFHLMNAPDASIQGLLAAFEELGVERCGATHCTGDRQIELIKARFGDRYVPMGTGRVIEVPGPGRGAS